MYTLNAYVVIVACQTLVIPADITLTIPVGSLLIVNGVFRIEGTAVNNETIQIRTGGQFAVTGGTLTNTGTIVNKSSFLNGPRQTEDSIVYPIVNNSGTIDNAEGALLNGGTFNNLTTGVINNTGGYILNKPPNLADESDGIINNSGFINNYQGGINNYGYFDTTVGTVDNNPGNFVYSYFEPEYGCVIGTIEGQENIFGLPPIRMC